MSVTLDVGMRSKEDVAPPPAVGSKKANEVDLGKLWRGEKLRDFEWRMRCLGLDASPEANALLRQMIECTETLNGIGDEIVSGERETKWWLDGEYDGEGAEESNDKGTKLFGERRYGEAFDSFTRAIGLWPSRAVYHANRASAALKLGKYEVCVSDCKEALKIDPSNVKVMTRCATGLQKAGRPREAKEYWRDVLDRDEGNAKAKKGYELACVEMRAAETKRRHEIEKSQAGLRTALPLRNVAEDWNDRLYSCMEMLQYEKSLSADLSVIEALIMCRRYADALSRLQALDSSTTEVAYLTAEAQWRSGLVTEAIRTLSQVSSRADKCAALREYLDEIGCLVKKARRSASEEVHLDSIEALQSVERLIDAEACSGLYADILRRKASSLVCRGCNEEASAALDSALRWEPEDQKCLLMRSKVRQKLKDYHGAMADLSILQSINASTPGLFKMMQKIACTILETKDSAYRIKSVKRRTGFDPFGVLGIPGDSDELAIRRAYRQLAAQWHPDKWLQKTEEQQEAASMKFKEIKMAYETLTTEC